MLKRDVFVNIDKKSSKNWQVIYDVSIQIFRFWTKFLTVHINQIQHWSCAGKALHEEDNEYPSLKSIGEDKSEEGVKLPDYVDLMINYRKYVKKKIKSKKYRKNLKYLIFFIKVNYEVFEYVYNMLYMLICKGELLIKEKKPKEGYLYWKKGLKFSEILLNSHNPDIITLCVKLRMLIIRFYLEYLKDSKALKLSLKTLVLLQYELKLRITLKMSDIQGKSNKKIAKTVKILFFKQKPIISLD